MTEKKEFNLVAVYDYLLGIRRHLLLIEKLQDQMFSVERRCIEGTYNEKRNEQFLFIGQETIENSIKHIGDCIGWIEKELELGEPQPDWLYGTDKDGDGE